MKNEMTLAFDSISENEAFARVAVAAFVTQLNPTLEEVADIKTAVSEAVTNAIIHGYPDGVHTSRPKQERSGMGFMFMEAFMDEVQVESEPGLGTTVTMRKTLGNAEE